MGKNYKNYLKKEPPYMHRERSQLILSANI